MKPIFLLATLALLGCRSADDVQLPEIVVPDAGREAVADQGAPADAARPQNELLSRVNPLIGTGGYAFQYAGMTPAVQVPLGMVKLGPDTTNNGSHPSEFHHFSGYWAHDPQIRGFSHLHFVGTGVADYGNLRVSVATGALDTLPEKWRAAKVHDTEVAAPGYYAVELANEAAVELTATLDGGLHRYRLSADATIAFDATSSVSDSGVQSSEVTVAPDGAIEGSVTYKGGYVGRGRPFTLYFAARPDVAPDEAFAFDADGFHPAATSATGTTAGAVLRYDAPTTVELRVGVSFIDLETARTHADIGSFEEVRSANEEQWIALLERVDFGSVTDEERVIATTALYNCFRMPTRFDEGGRYRGLDGEVHDVDHFYFTDLSLWDTYRTLHPLWTLAYPELQRDVLRSLLLMRRDGGYIPRWPAALSYTGGMEGDPAAMLFAEGALSGIDGVDYAAALDGLLDTANSAPPAESAYAGRSAIEAYLQYGYVPTDLDSAAASNSLEYPIADNAIANIAGFLGRPEETEFRDRATWYRNGWNTETQFFAPRLSDGSFYEPFSVTSYNDRSGRFAEGSAWHYRFHVLHDPEGLVELFGSQDALGDAIESFMTESRLFSGSANRLLAPDPHYWHGNEPALHSPFYLAAAGRWDRLSHWVGEIRTHAYSTDVDGLAGNDDGGTLSAWYVLSTLGLYPIVGTDRVIVFEPWADDVAVEGVQLPEPNQIVRYEVLR